MTTLTERRKADRAIMAEQVRAICAGLGVAAVVEPGIWSTRNLAVRIETARGLQLTIDFDGDSCQPDTFVLSWHMSLDSTARLSPRFGNINTCHHRKSTDVVWNFEQLCERLAMRLEQCAAGVAYEEDEPRLERGGVSLTQAQMDADLHAACEAE